MRSYLLGSVFVATIVGGLASPAHAIKQSNFSMGASCQVESLLGVLPSVSYTNSGIMVNSLTADLVCPITWSKSVLTAWTNLERVDIQVDWLGLPSGVTGMSGPNWGCTLAYQTAGGSLTMAPLPIPYPVPPAMVPMAYAALICTAPQAMGVQGYKVDMCFVSPTNPGGCQ